MTRTASDAAVVGTEPQRAALLTPAGRGAVAVIATRGSVAAAVIDQYFRAANGRPLSEQGAGQVILGRWRDGGADTTGEEVIVSPRSDGVVEVHCHGGAAAAGRILAALASGGCKTLLWQEWLALEASAPEIANVDQALAAARTLRTASILLDQRGGALARELEAAHRELNAGDSAAARGRLERVRARAPLGRRLTDPWSVAIAGRPNVGKSSLVNALLGYQRAIVFDQPGTTRDVLAAETAIDGWPVRLTDSAGIRETECDIESAGVALARQQAVSADLVLWVVDATTLCAPTPRAAFDAACREMQSDAGLDVDGVPALVVVNKIDLLPSPSMDSSDELAFVSATTGAGMADLLSAIAQGLVPSPPRPGDAVPLDAGELALVDEALARIA